MTGDSNLTVRDFAYCSRSDDRGLFGTPVLLERVTGAADRALRTVDGRFAGREPRGPEQTQSHDGKAARRVSLRRMDLPALLNALAAAGSAIEVVYVHGTGAASMT